MTRLQFTVLFALLSLLTSPRAAQCGLITVYATSDRDGTDAPRGGAFESLGLESAVSLSVSNQLNVAPLAERRAAFEFSLSSLAGATTINSAMLLLPITGLAGSTPPIVRVYGYAGDGAVTLADMLQTSNAVSGPISTFGLGTRSINVTTFIQTLVGSSTNYAGFLVTANLDTASELNMVQFGASNQPSSSFRTRLSIDYSEAAPVPEPSSLALLALGSLIGGLCCGCRQRRHG